MSSKKKYKYFNQNSESLFPKVYNNRGSYPMMIFINLHFFQKMWENEKYVWKISQKFSKIIACWGLNFNLIVFVPSRTFGFLPNGSSCFKGYFCKIYRYRILSCNNLCKPEVNYNARETLCFEVQNLPQISTS